MPSLLSPSAGCKNEAPTCEPLVRSCCSSALVHVVLHHFGDQPLSVKWWQAQLHPSVAAILCKSTDYISVVMPLIEKRS